MNTKVGRNDPCPCGSGKKYKKCCMKKENVVQLQDVKEERFYQQKLNLVNQLNDFILEQVPPNLYHPMEAEFKKRTGYKLGKNRRGFFNFWLYFFHRYENGLRGIEWFLAENKHRLSDEDKQMAERWANMKPQMIEAVDEKDTEVLFRDYFSGNKLNVPKSKENLPTFFPWNGTLALLEPIDGAYYFNGVRTLVKPKQFQHAANRAKQLINETDKDPEDVLVDYYPEILSALLEDPEAEVHGEQEMVTYTYMFLLNDKEEAERILSNDRDFGIDQWEEKHKKLTWQSNVQVFSDSEINGKVRLSEVNATLMIENKSLTFTTNDLSTAEQFLHKVENSEGAITLVENFEQRFKLPVKADSKQLAISYDEGVPEYFTLYAHNAMHTNIDKPIPMYQNQSLRQLVVSGQTALAEGWLKQAEYDLYKAVYEKYGSVEISADFNTVRKELGLSLSPFVTGGENRHSSVSPVSPEPREQHVVAENDVPIYEKLGFTPETVKAFYVRDIIAFYKEKTTGKSEGTERKYRNSLFDIREALEASSKQSWEDCDLEFWRDLLLVDFFDIHEQTSKSMIKDIITTVKALTKWLANEDKLAIDKQVAAAAKDYQKQMLEIYETEYQY
ncbi:YecA family protein [Sediminibacillus halophilus]|uniref:SEC-C motif-containing protein n=1 Tax=Sediminibacillus halophilus TaxID=482461 RepID=A0A1G9W640_9BACI|nr:SEC-C metal-binding domain-containing protein [Sediminibacillus halophilus]SDM79525.1 SEC-C motif-containing protein [Sediminibacillus halophilus]